MNLPNQLTVARLIMVPLFVVLMSFHSVAAYVLAYIVFLAATLTDYYDGKIARERNLITNFGKLLDPLADKVLMASAFIMMMKIPGLWIPAWTVVAILAREFLVTGARAVAAPEGKVIAANIWGKTKTVIQMVYIYTFLFFVIVGLLIERYAADFMEYYAPVLAWSSYIAMIFVAVFTVYSGIQFARANWQRLSLSSQT